MFPSPIALSPLLQAPSIFTADAAPLDPPTLAHTLSSLPLSPLSPFVATVTKSSQLLDSICLNFPLFSYSYELFCNHQNTKFSIFSWLRTLWRKHRVMGVPIRSRTSVLYPCHHLISHERDVLSASPFLHRLLRRKDAASKPVLGGHRKMSEEKSNQGGDRFPLTRWSVIDAARSADQSERVRALDTLCAAYWKPVYKYIRLRWNCPADDAQDLTQGFFVQLIERGLLEKYDSAKSRLRTFLRVCVDSFVMNEEKSAKRLKRGGNASHVALDFAGAEEELGGAIMDPAKIPSPESLEEFFEKEWVRGLFELAVEDLRKHCEANERERTFRLFEEYDLSGDETVSYDKLAEEYGIEVTDVTNALAWARREFRRVALGRLREICGSDEEFQREARSVFGWEAK
jgi:RNA polymerase sigma factor (sigma-70 family)